MPIYCYMCKECREGFEAEYKIDERELPLQNPCPKCGGKLFIDIAAVGVQLRGMPHKKPPEWFRDRLRAIKKRTPGNKINIT
jgi:putative FmdB family regulatory protein